MRDSEKMLLLVRWLKMGDLVRLNDFEVKKIQIFDDEGVDRFQEIDDAQMRFDFSMLTLSCDVLGDPIDISFSAKRLAAGTFLSNNDFLAVDTNGTGHVFECLKGPNLVPVRIKSAGNWHELDLEQFVDEIEPEDLKMVLREQPGRDGLVELAPSPTPYPGKLGPKF